MVIAQRCCSFTNQLPQGTQPSHPHTISAYCLNLSLCLLLSCFNLLQDFIPALHLCPQAGCKGISVKKLLLQLINEGEVLLVSLSFPVSFFTEGGQLS